MFAIENNINFYDEINKGDDLNDDENKCLITLQDLTNDFIQLDCGHKFNYDPLFKDIQNHKTKFNKLEKKCLSINEIRCPYCRTIHKKLLPLNERYPNVHGVNYINDEILLFNNSQNDYIWIQGNCEYSNNHILSNKICDTCNNKTVTYIDLFKLHLCIVHKNEYHYNYLLQKQQMKKEQEEKIKEEKKLAKIKAKQSVIKAKQLEIKAKQLEIKAEKNKNIVKCSQITKKGNQCSLISFKDGLCKMHSKMLEQSKLTKQSKMLNSNV
jgi:hypothetical protein